MAADDGFRPFAAENPQYEASFAQIIDDPRAAEPRDISDAVLWLASDESRTVTGIALPIDLGATRV
jgi:NAD(P)-dependent dehydrogenase (short-subunit alcohol dehydrogenase family)